MPLAAVLVMAVNDHWLKGAGLFPELVTGKLSDVAGVFYFPLLLIACIQGLNALVGRSPSVSRRVLVWGCVAATAVSFSAVKLWQPANDLVAATWGHMVMDPTDLLILPILGLTAAWTRRHSNSGSETLSP